MFNRTSTNADIANHDWAQGDRASLLRSLHASPAPPTPAATTSGFGTNVACSDPRSVRAYLVGGGDLRTTWWNFYSAVYMATVPGATLERAMFSFHQTHHRLTLGRLRFAHSLMLTAADVKREGIFNAAHKSILRETKR